MSKPKPELGGTTVASNALANVGRGAALSVVAIMLPAVLARTLVKPEFDVWMLLAQLTGYTTLLDLGMQVAVARFVALARARNDDQLERSSVSVGIQILLVPAVVAAIAYGLIIWFLPVMFPGVQDRLIGQARVGILVLAAAGVLGLPTSPLLGLAAGRQRSQISAAVSALSNVVGAIAVALLAWGGASIGMLAVGLAIPRIAGHLYQWHLARSILGDRAFRRRYLDPSVRRNLLSVSTTFAAWSAAAFIVSGLDVSMVGRFQFQAVGAYASVAAIVGVLVGIHTSVIAALLPVVTAAHERRESKLVVSLVLRSTRISLAIVAIPTTVLVIWAPLILRTWLVDVRLFFEAILILRILCLAAFLRIVTGVYAVALVSIGEHRRVVVTPLLEAAANLSFSILLGSMFGARGVAYGTLVGSVIGLAIRLLSDFPKTKAAIDLSAVSMLRNGIEPVLRGVVPVVLLWRLGREFWPVQMQFRTAAVVGIAVLMVSMWCLGLRDDDRDWARSLGASAWARLRRPQPTAEGTRA